VVRADDPTPLHVSLARYTGIYYVNSQTQGPRTLTSDPTRC